MSTQSMDTRVDDLDSSIGSIEKVMQKILQQMEKMIKQQAEVASKLNSIPSFGEEDAYGSSGRRIEGEGHDQNRSKAVRKEQIGSLIKDAERKIVEAESSLSMALEGGENIERGKKMNRDVLHSGLGRDPEIRICNNRDLLEKEMNGENLEKENRREIIGKRDEDRSDENLGQTTISPPLPPSSPRSKFSLPSQPPAPPFPQSLTRWPLLLTLSQFLPLLDHTEFTKKESIVGTRSTKETEKLPKPNPRVLIWPKSVMDLNWSINSTSMCLTMTRNRFWLGYLHQKLIPLLSRPLPLPLPWPPPMLTLLPPPLPAFTPLSPLTSTPQPPPLALNLREIEELVKLLWQKLIKKLDGELDLLDVGAATYGGPEIEVHFNFNSAMGLINSKTMVVCIIEGLCVVVLTDNGETDTHYYISEGVENKMGDRYVEFALMNLILIMVVCLSTLGIIVEVVQDEHMSLNSIVGLSTLEGMKLEGAVGQKVVVVIGNGELYCMCITLVEKLGFLIKMMRRCIFLETVYGAVNLQSIGQEMIVRRQIIEISRGNALSGRYLEISLTSSTTLKKKGGMVVKRSEVFVWKVGEKKERDTIALKDTKADVEEEIVPSEGIVILASKEFNKFPTANLDQKIGVRIAQHVLKMPAHTFAYNTVGTGATSIHGTIRTMKKGRDKQDENTIQQPIQDFVKRVLVGWMQQHEGGKTVWHKQSLHAGHSGELLLWGRITHDTWVRPINVKL